MCPLYRPTKLSLRTASVRTASVPLSVPPGCRYVDALEKQLGDAQVRNRDLIRAQPIGSAYGQRPAYGAQRPDLSHALAAERSMP